LQAERRHGGEGFQFFRWIGPKVGLCALEAGVAKPQRDLADVACSLERVHRAAMPQDVRRHALSRDRRLASGGDRDMFGQDVFESGPRQSPSRRAQEQLGVAVRHSGCAFRPIVIANSVRS
jgi:hypothetical protein